MELEKGKIQKYKRGLAKSLAYSMYKNLLHELINKRMRQSHRNRTAEADKLNQLRGRIRTLY